MKYTPPLTPTPQSWKDSYSAAVTDAPEQWDARHTAGATRRKVSLQRLRHEDPEKYERTLRFLEAAGQAGDVYADSLAKRRRAIDERGKP